MRLHIENAPQIEVGWKFAALGLPTNRVHHSFPASLRIDDGVWITKEPPFTIPDHWRDWLGAFRKRTIEEADLWLLATAPSERPEVADGDTKRLETRVRELYHSLLMAIDNMSHGEAIRVSGANTGEGPAVRGVQEYDRVYHILYSPRIPITPKEIETTASIASAIPKLKIEDKYRRVWRIVRAFHRANTESDPSERVHQHVRCIEGWIYPDRGATRDQFVGRVPMFAGSGAATELREMFDIRSATEHLHSPFRLLPAVPPREQRLLLLRRAIQAEAVARFTLRRFFLRPLLWPHYEDDQTLEHFWRHLTPVDREHLWGPPMDMNTALDDFNEDWIADEDLGLRDEPKVV